MIGLGYCVKFDQKLSKIYKWFRKGASKNLMWVGYFKNGVLPHNYRTLKREWKTL